VEPERRGRPTKTVHKLQRERRNTRRDLAGW